VGDSKRGFNRKERKESGAAALQPKADPIGHKDRKKGLGFDRNRARAYRRDAGSSIYLGFFVLFVAINSSRPASIFEDSNADAIWIKPIPRGSMVRILLSWLAGLDSVSVSIRAIRGQKYPSYSSRPEFRRFQNSA
jgi:hypothetical protein